VGPGRWVLTFAALPRADEPTTARCMALLEVALRSSPEDVFWLQERWKRSRAGAHLVNFKSTPGAVAAEECAWTKPRRALVWCAQVPVERPALPVPVPADVRYEWAWPEAPRPTWLRSEERVHAVRIPADLARVDAADALPLDFVYAPGGLIPLHRGCKLLGVALLTKLPPPPRAP
jgi:Kdo2-lipid IVA lauroyltransferase/acyltransferase